MKTIKLTEREKKTYEMIIEMGKIDEMFQYGYAVGQQRLAKEQVEAFKNKIKQ